MFEIAQEAIECCYAMDMKVLTVGATGYLGSEILHQTRAMGYEALGTFHSQESAGLARFKLEDRTTWNTLTDQKPDAVIWTAWPGKEYPVSDDPFADLLDELHETKFVYISSDAAFCNRSLAAATSLGDYARRKHAEQTMVLTNPEFVVFVTGPIYGEDSQGTTDDRTQKLLDEPSQGREYWDNVYKTFVPVKGLAKTVLGNLDKAGLYFAGPPERNSYFDFYVSRAQHYRLPTDAFHPVEIADAKLAELGICIDTSYGNNPRRLWEA